MPPSPRGQLNVSASSVCPSLARGKAAPRAPVCPVQLPLALPAHCWQGDLPELQL